MAESKEYSTIVKCRRKLEIALESDRDIAQFLLQQGFITQERCDEVINPKSNLTDADKASMLVTAIRNRVELNPRNYHKVVDHLRQNTKRYGDIVEILDQYHQTTAVDSPLQQPVIATPSSSHPAVPNASPSPRSPCEGTTSNPPPSSGSFSASTIQSSTDGATPSKDNSGKSATAEERFPYLKSEHLSEEERGMLIGRLVADSEDIRSKFSFLLIQTTKSFTSAKISLQYLKIVLEPYKISELNESDDDISKILLKAFHYCSLFSFKIVKDIINYLGTNDDKERLAEYETSFKDYCKRRLCEVPIEVLNPGGSRKKEETKSGKKETKLFYVKTDEIFDVPSEKIYVIQSDISKILDKPIHLKGIKEGCVELIFYLLHELDEIFPLNEKQMNLLKGIGVSRVYDEHKEYFSLSKDSPNENLKQHVQTLGDEFQDISVKTFEAIKKKALDISRFRAQLEALYIEYRDQHKEFFRQLMDFPEKDTTIDHIWTRLSGHWHFLNYTLLENLVYEFGDHTLKADMGDYMKRLKLFRSSTRICDFAKYYSKVDKKLPKQDFQDLVTESKLSWSKSTLEDLEKVKENLTQQFSLPSFVMNLKDVVQQGSIRITWRLPTLIASGLRENLENMDISELYKENGIECILIDGKEFSEGTKSMLTTPTTPPPSDSSPVPSKQSSINISRRTQPCGKDVSDNSDSSSSSREILEKKIQDLEDQFNEIAIKTFDKIDEMDLNIRKFRARLIALPIKYREQHKEFFQQLKNDIEKDKTIEDVWIRLSEYWDFLNYTLLENLVHKFGDQSLNASMNDYIKKLKEFRSSTHVCDFAEYCTKINERLKKHHLQDIILKFNQSWEECTLEDLENLKENISHKFFLPSFVMNLKDIQPRSIVVTWTLPTLIASAIMEILETTYVSEFCNENGIESITIDGKEIIYSPSKDYEAYEAFLKDISFTMKGKNFDASKLAPIMEKYRCGNVRVRASGSVIVHSTSSWTPLDYYSLGYTLANSPLKWELYFYSSMGDEEMKEMCRGMLKCTESSESGKDIHVHFGGNISVEGLEQFVKVPHHLLQRIVTLDFSSNKLDKRALDLLSQVIPALSRLEVLNLSSNPIGEGGAVELMRALSLYKTPLKQLKLQRTSLGEEDIQALCEVLADNHIELLAIDGPTISIMRLHVQTIRVKTLCVYPPMSVGNCTSLASLLKHCTCQLKNLDIPVCSINSDGAVSLAAALSENKSVVKVNMRWNEDIGDVGAGAFGDMLRKNTVLRELNLSHCGITSQGCDRLAGGVRANSTLQVLDLSDNRVGEKGVDLMLTSLQSNKTLRTLILPRIYMQPADPRVRWGGYMTSEAFIPTKQSPEKAPSRRQDTSQAMSWPAKTSTSIDIEVLQTASDMSEPLEESSRFVSTSTQSKLFPVAEMDSKKTSHRKQADPTPSFFTRAKQWLQSRFRRRQPEVPRSKLYSLEESEDWPQSSRVPSSPSPPLHDPTPSSSTKSRQPEVSRSQLEFSSTYHKSSKRDPTLSSSRLYLED